MKKLYPKNFAHLLPTLVAVVGLGALVLYYDNQYNLVQNEKLEILSELEKTKINNLSLIESTRYLQSVIDSFEGQINRLGSTVGTLEKLSQTDKELLKKYSKVYFLNENYVPAALDEIDAEYVYNGTSNFLIHAKAWPYLRNLLIRARADGVDLLVASAYRSFNTQAVLKSEYKITYGSGANQFSADQGYSEHQLGTAVDLTTSKLGAYFSKFNTDPGYEWLLDHAHEYGFILSYPENNTYYKFEPWHWRFVGISLAKTLYKEGKHFYDLDQREIDPYLINIFD